MTNDFEASPPDPTLSPTEYVDLGNGVRMAYVCEGAGGAPLLLVHGYPETKRIWWRNLMPLADAGFEVIAPDLRGHGESSLAPDGFYDVAAFSTDLYTLMHDVLGHAHCFVAGGDVGGPVVYDLSLRYPGFVKKLCFFNTVTPYLDAEYEAAGIPPDAPTALRSTGDYFMRQATDADGLLAELDSPERRRAYVADMYGHRLWAGRGAFSPADVDFMTEPYADADKLRASWGVYESSTGNRAMSDVPRYLETNPVPALVFYGPEDHVVPRSFPARCSVAFTDCIGPFEIAGSGHFLQWEAADIFNRALTHFFL
jgi:pimeloyl-ACP methyl ester carboxylesterase